MDIPYTVLVHNVLLECFGINNSLRINGQMRNGFRIVGFLCWIELATGQWSPMMVVVAHAAFEAWLAICRFKESVIREIFVSRLFIDCTVPSRARAQYFYLPTNQRSRALPSVLRRAVSEVGGYGRHQPDWRTLPHRLWTGGAFDALRLNFWPTRIRPQSARGISGPGLSVVNTLISFYVEPPSSAYLNKPCPI